MADLLTIALMGMRLIVFGLALGLTLISFQAYSKQRTENLQFAFIGFAFISMGVALTSLGTQVEEFVRVFGIVETIPFIIGFSMLYMSLYR
jgi:heme/copper-type cytochrome/quinol oxidase subunit 4